VSETFRLPPLPDVNGLEIESNPADLHHDLFVYLEYVGERSIKRSTRDNSLPKGDLRELARRMTEPGAIEAIKEGGSSAWISFIEFLAWHMKLASFASGPGYLQHFIYESLGERDNYVIVTESRLKELLARPAVQQEAALRQALIEMPLSSFNELFDTSPQGRLDSFNTWERSASVAPQADFPAARQLLISLLAQLPAGVWFSTADLVAYLKANHPYFLLPKKIQKMGYQRSTNRYAGFNESTQPGQWSRDEIQESDPDAFERFEGRFVERFLESLPLLLRYVELAYDPQPYTGKFPTRGTLRAFRVNNRFLHLMFDQTPPVKVTVQPNFEVMVVSEVYPADLLAQLRPLSEVVSQSTGQSGPTVAVLRLKKDRVAARAAALPDLDVVELLQRVSGQTLAQNVVTELREWTAHSESFVLYDGFGLLESDQPLPANLPKNLIAAEISPNLHLVRHPEKIYPLLAKAGALVLITRHPEQQLGILNDHSQTVFATVSRPLAVKEEAQPVVVKREEKVILRFNGQREAFEALRAALAELRVPLETIDRDLTILFPKAYDPQLEQAVRAVAKQFTISIQGNGK